MISDSQVLTKMLAFKGTAIFLIQPVRQLFDILIYITQLFPPRG
jgi:hypothetical protein